MITQAPSHEEVVQSLIRQASVELVDKINKSHAECYEWADKLKDAALGSINKARETGLYLIELEEQTPHGKWLALFQSKTTPNAPIGFNDVTASRWIRLAKALPEPITSLPDGIRHLTDMLKAVHALPESQGHGDQTKHEGRSPFQALTKFAGEIQGCLSQWRKDKPLEDWSPELKDQVKSQLEPVVKFYQSLQ